MKIISKKDPNEDEDMMQGYKLEDKTKPCQKKLNGITYHDHAINNFGYCECQKDRIEPEEQFYLTGAQLNKHWEKKYWQLLKSTDDPYDILDFISKELESEYQRGVRETENWTDIKIESTKSEIKKEIIEIIKNMPIETVGNSAKTVDQIIKLIL